MSTVTPTLAGHTVITADLSKPKIGQPTVVAFFGGDHKVLLSLAHVLAIGPVDPITEEPTLTVAYPTQPADERKLGSVRWSDAFTRVTGVQHWSHPDAKAGRLAVAWGGDGDIEIAQVPEIPTPTGAGSVENPVFQRQELTVPPSTATVSSEALAAQHGQAPEGSHVSPATSEAGQVHDAVVTSSQQDNGPVAAAEGNVADNPKAKAD